jgi:hypothetical protein
MNSRFASTRRISTTAPLHERARPPARRHSFGLLSTLILVCAGVGVACDADEPTEGQGAPLASGCEDAKGGAADAAKPSGGEAIEGGGASGDVIKAASCSSQDTQKAIDSAKAGDIIMLPGPCSATWDRGITIPDTKGITLNGESAAITRGNLGQWDPLVKISPNATTSTRITGFRFTYSGKAEGYFILVSGGNERSAKFRIDHASFTGRDLGRHIGVNAPVYGVIDHCSFIWEGNNEVIHNEAYGPGNQGWSSDVVPGSADALYIEDNEFRNEVGGKPAYFWGGSAVQGYYGARTVVRHNALHMAQIDMHGTAGMLGARWWEIYENTFHVVENGNQDKYLDLRAGSGVVFNNHKTGANNGGAGAIKLREEDSGYPALYQIGRGKDQAADPAYVWGNDASMPVSSGSSNVQEGRDFFKSAKPGYTPYTYPHPMTKIP